MSASPFRWRLPNRKSSTPFFPGAWPNGSMQGSDLTRNSAPDSGERIAGDAVLTTPSKFDRRKGTQVERGEAAVNASEPLQHIDHVTDFHHRLSLSLESSHIDPRGSLSLESVLPGLTNTSRMPSETDVCTSPSNSTVATPSPLSPATSVSLPLTKPAQTRKKSFALPRIITYDKCPHKSIRSRSVGPSPSRDNSNPVPSSGDIQSSSAVPGLPPLSLPSHTLSFSPESVASYFSSSEQSSRPASHIAASPPAPPSPSSITPASFVIPSPISPEPSLPEITSSSGFAASFYPIASESDLRGRRIRGLLSPSTTDSSQGYRDDSPVLPSDNEANGIFLSPISPPQRGALTPSSAEMDAFGVAASGVPPAPSEDSIPTSLRSGFAAESLGNLDDTPQTRAYRHVGRSNSSLSLSLSSVGTVSIHHYADEVEDDLTLSRQQHFVAPASRTMDRHAVSAQRAVTSTVAAPHQSPSPVKLSGLEKVKKISGKIKRLFTFKSKSSVMADSQIGVTTTTAVTAVEYTSEHPIPLAGPKRRKNDTSVSPKSPTPKNLTQRHRRRSLPATAATSAASVSRPRALRPVSFLAIEPKASSGPRTLLSPSKLAELHQALGGRMGSRSSVRLRNEQAETKETSSEEMPVTTGQQKRTSTSVERVAGTPSSAQVRRTRTHTAPGTSSPPSSAKARRFSLSSGLTNSKMDLLRTAVTPHPPLPLFSRDEFGRVRGPGSDSNAGSAANQQKNKTAEAGSRRAKAQSIIMGHIQSRKPVPTLQDNTTMETVRRGVVNLGEPDGQAEAEYRGQAQEPPLAAEKNSQCLSAPATPRPGTVPHAICPGERDGGKPSSPDVAKRRRSRAFSFTSNVSRRAQKARSMIVGRTDRQSVELPSSFKRNDIASSSRKGLYRTMTRGSSFGCAEYEPDLVIEDMSFAPKPEPSSSAVSESEVPLDHAIPEGTVYTILSGELVVREQHHSVSVEDRDDSSQGNGDETVTEHEGQRARERDLVSVLGLIE